MTMLRSLSLLAVLAALASTAAVAGPTCKVPKETWMKEADFRAKLEAEGYKIKNFKVTQGECYEIYGFDKDGKKVEIYFNPVSGDAVKSNVES